MIAVDEVLTMRVGKARAKFLEEVAIALNEAAAGSVPAPAPTQADIEGGLQVQIGQGTKLLEMAESACTDPATYVKVPPSVHEVLMDSLAEAVKHFGDLQRIATEWTHRHGVQLEGRQELAALLSRLADRRADLMAARHDVFPGLELHKVSQAIKDLDAGRGRPLERILSDSAR